MSNKLVTILQALYEKVIKRVRRGKKEKKKQSWKSKYIVESPVKLRDYNGKLKRETVWS